MYKETENDVFTLVKYLPLGKCEMDCKTFEAVISSDKVDYRALEHQAEQ